MRLVVGCLLAAASGFVALSYEILWFRTYSFLSWGRARSFGLLLGAYLAGLALGAFLARRYCGRGERRELQVLALFLLAANLAGYLLIPAVAELATHGLSLAALPAVGLVAALLGTALPLIAHFGIPSGPGVGHRLSFVYLANILGSAAGSLLTGFLFLDWWSLETISVLLALLGLSMCGAVALLGGLTLRTRAGAWLAITAGAIIVVVGSPTLFLGTYEKMLFKEDYRPGYRARSIVENRSGVIVVDHDGTVYGDGVYDGRFNTDPIRDTNGITRAYAAVALHRTPRSVLVVGLGTGSWAQVLVHHPAVERMTVVEINPGYLDILELSDAVSSLLSNPKVVFVVDDARRWLARTDERFDLVLQNTTYHFRAHATNLLSKEYLELVRRHLVPGGLLVYNTTWSEEAQRTGLEVFRNGVLYRNAMYVSDGPLSLDREYWWRVLADYRIDGRPVFDLARAEDREALDFLAHDDRWIDGEALLERTRDATVITDDNMACEWELAR